MSETKYFVPVGPIHPAFKEPFKFTFGIEGEKIVDVDLQMGENHRGIEWMAMKKRNPIQVIYLAERICGICSASHPFAFTRAVEDAMNLEVPLRAQYIRVIIAELERIHSHVLWAGVGAHEIGFDTLLHLTWLLREKVMDILEMLTGNRVNYGIWQIGGVRRDITKEKITSVKRVLDEYKEKFNKVYDLFLRDKTIAMRTVDVGVMTYRQALELCAVGPTTRASGVPKDIRVDMPYEGYVDLEIEPVLPTMVRDETHGDVYDRVIVRVLEIAQSIDIIEQTFDILLDTPEGDILAEKNIAKLLNVMLKKADGEGVGRHEAPRGEVYHYVRLEEGKTEIETWKARAPTFNNVYTWVPQMLGNEIADIPIITAAIDPCIACMDRVTVVDETKNSQILTKEDMHRMSIEKTRRLRI